MSRGDAQGWHAAAGTLQWDCWGTVEHMSDDLFSYAAQLGLPWAPPGELCRRSLSRLFPDAPADTDPWETLLWATGRRQLAGQPPVSSWDWYAGPPGDRTRQ
jgi:hypothetical protein